MVNVAIVLSSLLFTQISVAQQESPPAQVKDDGQVFVADKLILDIRQDAPECFDVGDISYSPKYPYFLVLLDCIEGDNVAFLFKVDGSDKRQITTKTDYINYYEYDWSPDGQWLVYQQIKPFGEGSASGSSPTGIVRYSVETGKKEILVKHFNAVSLHWSPDGKSIAFYVIDNIGSKTTLYLLSSDGTILWQLDSLVSTDQTAMLSWMSDTSNRVPLLKYTSSDGLLNRVYSVSYSQSSSFATLSSIFPYAVVGVNFQDTLNIRSNAGASNSVVGTIPPNGTGILKTGQGVRHGNSIWLPIQYGDLVGWVNSTYLEPQLGSDATQDASSTIYVSSADANMVASQEIGNTTGNCSYQITKGNVQGLIDAINHANADSKHDTICLAEGSYTLKEANNRSVDNGANGLPIISSDITIIGLGSEKTGILRGADAPKMRIFEVNSAGKLIIRDLFVASGLTEELTPGVGGAILNHGGTVLIQDSEFLNNYGWEGGAIYSDGNLIITRSSFLNNIAENDGGAIENGSTGTAAVSDSQFIGNSLISSSNSRIMYTGGALLNAGTLTITRTIITGNKAYDNASAIANGNQLTITESCIYGNRVELPNDTLHEIASVISGRNAITIATNNWWGAKDGPSGAGKGTGDSVGQNVNFTSFSKAEDCPFEYLPQIKLPMTKDEMEKTLAQLPPEYAEVFQKVSELYEKRANVFATYDLSEYIIRALHGKPNMWESFCALATSVDIIFPGNKSIRLSTAGCTWGKVGAKIISGAILGWTIASQASILLALVPILLEPEKYIDPWLTPINEFAWSLPLTCTLFAGADICKR